MRIKLSKIAKDLNVGVNTVAEFLKRHNIEVDAGNPNARIGEDAEALLKREFSNDKDAKEKSDKFTTTRMSDKKAARAEKNREAEAAHQAPAPGLKVLGKIDLKHPERPMQPAQAPEKPVVVEKQAPEKAAPAPKAEKPAPKAPETQAPRAQAPAETRRPQTAAPQQPAQRPDRERQRDKTQRQQSRQTESPKGAPAAPAAPKDTTPRPQAAPAPSQAPAVQPVKTATPEQPVKTEVFRLNAPAAPQELKVLGKIDLSAINQSTRPKKKGKEERRRERADKNRGGSTQQAAGDSASADRKRRKRIGKEKVDIEKAVSQPGFGADKKSRSDSQQGGQRQERRGDRDRDRGRNKERKDRQAPRQEPNAEDVQKQVKETLARLTNKPAKKAVKWRKEKREAIHNRELENARREEAESKVIKITEFVTANDLANLMEIPVNNVIATCMNLGVMVSINQRLDAETINIVAEEFGFTTEYVSADVTEAIATEEDSEENLVPRPPIVTVMGHVDHGKTSLLDYIRKANVIAGEAGGITQHIGAYNVKLSDGRHITFLDTPGHEAFTAMRARGAKVTDLAIIIVAADDDVMPQTIEAINHASAAGVPMVFAINKIDKPTANPDKIKEELANMNYLVEEWGGKYQSQDISAKKGIGVEELMEKVLLEAELLDLKANPDRAAIGSVIESSLDKGRGYVATVLVQNGTLRVGDVLLAGTNYGKIKAMFNERNQRVTEAGPATPVLVLGLNGAPTAGDTFNVLPTEQEAREIAGKREQLQRELGLRTKKRPGLEELGRRRALNDFHELNLVVKGDVDGSVEALSDSLIKLSTPEIQVNVLHKGVGAISESDVTLAAASDAIIIGFQVRPSGAARREAEKEGVEIRLYSVIYKAIEEVKDAMEGLLSPEIKEEITGTAEVLQTYHISKVGTIAGAIVRDGKIKRTSKVRVIRDGIVIYTGELGSLKRFKDDVKEVVSGYDCGLSVQGYNDIREGDLIEAFEEVEVKKTL